MQPRRSSALPSVLLAATLSLAALGLTACGFGPATQEQYTPAAGANDRADEVKVLNAVVVAAQPDSGTFIASLVNNADETATFEGISGDEGNVVVPGEFAAVEIEPQTLLNLAEDGGPTLTGQFEAGEYLTLAVNFAGGEAITLDVPVVTACGDFLGLDDSVVDGETEEAYSCEPAEVEEEEDSAE